MVPCFRSITSRNQGILPKPVPLSDLDSSTRRHMARDLQFKVLRIIETSFGQTRNSEYSTAAEAMPPSSTAQEAILPRVSAGESRAMNLCITRYGGLVWSIVRKFVKESAEAEDLVQEVFTEIWKKASAFDPAVAPEATFIGLIARRRSIDFLRRKGRQPGFETMDAADSIPLPTSETSSVTCDPETIKASVASLPTDTRELFQLFFDHGFTHPEIAEKTGLPLGTVKTRLRRGLITLREQLQRAGFSNIQPAL